MVNRMSSVALMRTLRGGKVKIKFVKTIWIFYWEKKKNNNKNWIISLLDWSELAVIRLPITEDRIKLIHDLVFNLENVFRIQK